MGEGREGDWECGSCRNRNYAFRSFCNRCKQPRLLVDQKTPADSKWLPRIGDWICTGCSNNNYASREMCKKCGQPKEENEMPAIRMAGAPVSSYSHYFSRMQGLLASKMNFGIAGNSTFQRWMPGNSAFQQSLPTMSGWPYMILPGNSSGDISYTVSSDQLPGTPKGWRDGDWICNCGFHNYSSRSQCKRCNEPIPTNGMRSSTVNSTVANLYRASGTKRLASEEFVNDWDKKRLNAGDISLPLLVSERQQIYLDMEKLPGPSGGQARELYSNFPHTNLSKVGTQLPAMPTLLGKGAKQWRQGDWMCQKCNNHNYASRSYCNRRTGEGKRGNAGLFADSPGGPQSRGVVVERQKSRLPLAGVTNRARGRGKSWRSLVAEGGNWEKPCASLGLLTYFAKITNRPLLAKPGWFPVGRSNREVHRFLTGAAEKVFNRDRTVLGTRRVRPIRSAFSQAWCLHKNSMVPLWCKAVKDAPSQPVSVA